ncbi:MAG: toxin-antitoxin system HicB family antitoxin [Lactococcus chungangensis]|nr:toxin-antitoxin system HicB family antitoxin [Lactococcus chungangensis]
MGTFSLRLTDSKHEKLKIIAENQGRSLNKQIEYVLYQYVTDYEKINGKIETKEE